MATTPAIARNGEPSRASQAAPAASAPSGQATRSKARSRAPAKDPSLLRPALRKVKPRHTPPTHRGLTRPPQASGNSARPGPLHKVTAATIDPTTTGRPLTSGEVQLLRGIFGDSLNYESICVFNKKYTIFQANDVAMAPDGNIYLPRQSNMYVPDFSEAGPSLKALFVHEMTHVWQHQSGHNVLVEAGMLHLFSSDPCAYTVGGSFDDYNLEQQAEIIKHHFILTTYPEWASTFQISGTLADYQRTLERFLADPSYRRRDKDAEGYDSDSPFNDDTGAGTEEETLRA